MVFWIHAMPQLQFPLFPAGSVDITAWLGFSKQDGQVTYFVAGLPVFVHAEDDLASFRMITAQFCVNGHAKQAEIARAFGIPSITVKRAVKLYRQTGPKGFYATRKTRGAAILTESVLANAQGLLDEGMPKAEVADQLGILRDTLSKAIVAGRLHASPKKRLPK